MIKLDENLLSELGLGGLPKPEKTAFLKHMYETLEMRVGTRLAERMSDQQMSEFEQYINSNDEQGAFHWLEANFPNYKQVVAEEFDKLKGEIQPLAPQIIAASQAQAAQGGAAGSVPESTSAGVPQQQQYAQPTPSVSQDAYANSQQFQQSQQPAAPSNQQPAYGPAPASPQSPTFGQGQASTNGYAAPSFGTGFGQQQSVGSPSSAAYQQPQPQQQPYYDAPQNQPNPDPAQSAGQFGGGYQPAANQQQPAAFGSSQPQPALDNNGSSQQPQPQFDGSQQQQQYQPSAPANPFGPAPQFGPAPSQPQQQPPAYGQQSQPAPSSFGQQPPQPGQ